MQSHPDSCPNAPWPASSEWSIGSWEKDPPISHCLLLAWKRRSCDCFGVVAGVDCGGCLVDEDDAAVAVESLVWDQFFVVVPGPLLWRVAAAVDLGTGSEPARPKQPFRQSREYPMNWTLL